MTKKTSQPVYAILSGGGALPSILAAAAENKSWPTHVITFSGQPQPTPMPRAESFKEFPLGQIGHILAHLRGLNVTHVSLAGSLTKPSLFNLKPDAAGLKLLARAAMMHDDALLRAVTATLQDNDLTVVGVQEMAPDLLAPEGTLTKTKPSEQDRNDIALARSVLSVIGDLDIGQAAVVMGGVILGVEAVEGTDDLIRRCANLRGEGGSAKNKAAILVKRAKPTQTDLADLPAVGPTTLSLLATHHYKGLAVQAGKTLLLSQPDLLATANAHHLFITSDT